MNFNVTERSVPSSDGSHTLKGKVFIPDGSIKGLFHLVHGMTEYIGRYDPVLSAAAKLGYVCFGYDNLGHGKTAADDSELGFIAHKNGYRCLIDDIFKFETAIRQDYPGLPCVLMGHSMGSFIARLAAEEHGDTLSGLIICGTGGPQPAAPFGLLATDILKLIRGEKHKSPLIEKMAFGTYNKRFEGQSKYDWITKDRENITKYAADPYCTFSFTVSAMHDLVRLNMRCNRRKWFANLRKDLPVLMISGTDDPVGDYGKGVQTVYNRLKRAGMQDVRLKMYPGCRHEIHNDVCKDEVIAEILLFLSKAMP